MDGSWEQWWCLHCPERIAFFPLDATFANFLSFTAIRQLLPSSTGNSTSLYLVQNVDGFVDIVDIDSSNIIINKQLLAGR